MSRNEDDADPVARVTPLELFFDLVFVFTITQLTSLLATRLTWGAIWHVIVMLGLIFWMYDGYAWLTNAVPAEGSSRQAMLLGAMAGYLVLAISIPDAFAGAGLTFGLAYLVINVIHAFLYVSQAAESSSAAMRALAPGNLLTAVAVLVAGALGGEVQAIVWSAVFLYLWFGTHAGGGFQIGPAHFVERHGLLVLIAIGESIVAAGIGARGLTINLRLVVVVVLALLLSAELWWTYFGEGTELVERAFRSATGPDRVRKAFVGFGYAHYVMLLGVVFVAVGLRVAVSQPSASLDAGRAFTLSGGAALFLAGDGWFRSILGLRPRWRRPLGALAVLLAVPVATTVSAVAALAVTTAIVGLVIMLERRVPREANAAEAQGFVKARRFGAG
ncbi:MAG: low temperature requirement protein A [Actinomycetota bacterium]|nr:low temperature requirement protein A [Actinomycetota bacterium]